MLQINGYHFEEDLYYDDHHQYARVEGDIVTIGLSHYAQAAAKEINFVGLPRPGRKVEQGKPIGSVESGKWVGRLYAPVSGEVSAANQALEDDPTLINQDPYGAGWIVKLRATDLGQLTGLRRCTDADFQAWFAAEVARNQQ
jgi:glycine cleavage system H protein